MFEPGWISLVQWFLKGEYEDHLDEELRDFVLTCNVLQKIYMDTLSAHIAATERIYVYDGNHIAIDHSVRVVNPSAFAATRRDMIEISEGLDVVRMAHVSNRLLLADSESVSNLKSAQILAEAYWSLVHTLAVTKADPPMQQTARELMERTQQKIADSRAKYPAMWSTIDTRVVRQGRVALYKEVSTGMEFLSVA